MPDDGQMQDKKEKPFVESSVGIIDGTIKGALGLSLWLWVLFLGAGSEGFKWQFGVGGPFGYVPMDAGE